MGQREESIAALKRAQALDPLSLEINAGVGVVFHHARQYDQAIEQHRKVIDMDPNFWFARAALGSVYISKGMYSEAIAEFQKARLIEDHPRMLAGLGSAYALAGQRAEAQKALDELIELSKRGYIDPWGIAHVFAALGEKGQAFGWLEKAYQVRAPFLAGLKVLPAVDSLRSDPRFADLMRRVGLPP
jgi:tetratricopeptide (TPR) repeat protein